MDLIIVSGLSGSGKSRVAAVLEDMDFYCVDNMPVSLMPRFVELCSNSPDKYHRVALVTDVRTLDNFEDLFYALDELKRMGVSARIVFVEASTAVIVKRYKETRRRHPLAGDTTDLAEAVRMERQRLEHVRQRADYVVDTSDLTLGQLQRAMARLLSTTDGEREITVCLVSFGYKNGVPIDADLVFDVRCLPNPHYEEALQPMTGLDKSVQEYVFASAVSRGMFERTLELLEFLLPHYIEEGKRHLVVCIGCTGGRHRSVSMAVRLGQALTEKGYFVTYRHRDIEK